jgi:hypothetical protein
MFFTRFVFTLSYRPGSQNVKADALSRLYDTEERSMDQTPILPDFCLVAPVVWVLDADIEHVLHTEPAPSSVPSGVCTLRLLSVTSLSIGPTRHPPLIIRGSDGRCVV